MDAFLIGDLLHILAENIDSRATLAALCQVSKKCHAVFTPVLYRKIWIYPRSSWSPQSGQYEDESILTTFDHIWVSISVKCLKISPKCLLTSITQRHSPKRLISDSSRASTCIIADYTNTVPFRYRIFRKWPTYGHWCKSILLLLFKTFMDDIHRIVGQDFGLRATIMKVNDLNLDELISNICVVGMLKLDFPFYKLNGSPTFGNIRKLQLFGLRIITSSLIPKIADGEDSFLSYSAPDTVLFPISKHKINYRNWFKIRFWESWF